MILQNKWIFSYLQINKKNYKRTAYFPACHYSKFPLNSFHYPKLHDGVLSAPGHRSTRPWSEFHIQLQYNLVTFQILGTARLTARDNNRQAKNRRLLENPRWGLSLPGDCLLRYGRSPFLNNSSLILHNLDPFQVPRWSGVVLPCKLGGWVLQTKYVCRIIHNWK